MSKQLTNLSVAIAHDSFLYQGGAERVLLALLELFPHADVYIPLIRNKYKKTVSSKTTGQLHTWWLNNLPIPTAISSLLKPLVLDYWEKLDLSSYDLVISSSHSFSAKSIRVHRPTLHLSYIHTPPRYLYGLENEMNWINHRLLKMLLKPILSYLRKKDIEAAHRPDLLIANSKTVQHRIAHFYNRKSQIIYPPISIPQKIDKKTNGDYYVCVSRLVKQKGIQLAIEACNRLQKKLLVVGTGPYRKELEKIAGPTVTFQGFVSDDKLSQLYSRATALIYCSRDEDFGMVPAEALAHGVPVIGYNSGGTTETITPQTGVLFDDFSVESLCAALVSFEKKPISSQACRQRAAVFSTDRFNDQLKSAVLQLVEQNK